MKKLALILALTLSTLMWAEGPWKFRMVNPEAQINLHIDLYEESIEVPGMSMFGPMNGYINGKGVYGVWMVTTCKIKSDKEAVIHLSNDLGSETQVVELTLQNDSTCIFEQVNGNVIKKAVNRKLVKIPSKLTFQKKP